MRVLFVGTVEFSKIALQKLIDMKVDIIAVATKKSSTFNADFADLTPLCVKHGITYRFIDDINANDTVEWVRGIAPDIIFCFGWSYLIKTELLKIPKEGIIGYHPAAVPKNRGRHPLIWALVLGLSESASTFFFMDEGADSGDILSQEIFEIKYEDDARSLKDKVHAIGLKQIEAFVPKLANKTYQRLPQNHNAANTWRKRTKKDGEIDFRMSSRAIYYLVRALTKPYIGAHVFFKGHEIKIWEAKEVPVYMANIEYGKILGVKDNKILVKCFDGGILLINHEFKEMPKIGEYLL